MVDEIDTKILEILKLNGRASVKEIAEATGSSSATISRKIKKLEQVNIIKGYVSIIRDEELGKGSRAVFLIRTSGDYDQEELASQLIGMEDICDVFTTMGNYDMIATACTTSEAQLYQMINDIRSLPSVLWVDSTSIVSRRKVLSKVIYEDD